MRAYIVTERTSPKVKGEVLPPGTRIMLDPVADYLVIDQLTECGTLKPARKTAKAKPHASAH